MRDPKIIFCVFLTILVAVLLGWSYIQNNDIKDLSITNSLLQSNVKEIEKNNNLLRLEVQRVKEFAAAHHAMTEGTKNKNQELLDEINTIEKDNKIWFDSKCPDGIDCVLEKNSN